MREDEVVFFLFGGGGEFFDGFLLESSERTLFLFFVTPFFKEGALLSEVSEGNWDDNPVWPSKSFKYFLTSQITSGSCQNGIKFGIEEENS